MIGYYARRIAVEVKLPSQFAALAPKVRDFLERKAFGQPVNLEEAGLLKAISSDVAQYVTAKAFVESLRELVLTEPEPQLLHPGRPLSETPPFPWSRPTLAADKSVFNLVPCQNEFEKRFARFLQGADDVQRFAKLPEQFGFALEYTDNRGNLRYYEPDFAVLANDGRRYIVETKGLEDVNVAYKERAARLWCTNSTKLTGLKWEYLNRPADGFPTVSAYGVFRPAFHVSMSRPRYLTPSPPALTTQAELPASTKSCGQARTLLVVY